MDPCGWWWEGLLSWAPGCLGTLGQGPAAHGGAGKEIGAPGCGSCSRWLPGKETLVSGLHLPWLAAKGRHLAPFALCGKKWSRFSFPAFTP